MGVKINQREKRFIFSGTVILGFIFLCYFFVFPLIEKNRRLELELQSKKNTLMEMTLLQAKYQKFKKEAETTLARLEKRKKGFSLFSFLDNLAGKTNIKSQVVYMKPSQTPLEDSPFKVARVEMKIQDLTISQLVTYLHMVEFSKNLVTIQKWSISKKDDKSKRVNAVLLVDTLIK
jgi:general secretion pathway protein M